MKIKKRIAEYFAKIPFIYNAISQKADLSAFTVKLENHVIKKNIIGLALIILSYVICWPIIIFLGFLSISGNKPLIIIIGGPVIYFIAHLIFMLGIYLTGAHYTMIFLRWGTRKLVEIFIDRNEILSAAERMNSSKNQE